MSYNEWYWNTMQRNLNTGSKKLSGGYNEWFYNGGYEHWLRSGGMENADSYSVDHTTGGGDLQDQLNGTIEWLEGVSTLGNQISASVGVRSNHYNDSENLKLNQQADRQRISDYQTQMGGYLSFLYRNKKAIDAMYGEGKADELIEYMHRGNWALLKMDQGLTSEWAYWNRFESEAEYNGTAKLLPELAELEPYRAIAAAAPDNDSPESADARADYQLKREELKIDEKLAAARPYWENDADLKYVILPFMPDFEEKSKYVSTANGTTQSWLEIMTDAPDLSGYDDLYYEAINGNQDAIYQLEANAAKNGEGLETIMSTILAPHRTYEELTPQEVAKFNYLYATSGEEDAYAYLRGMSSELNMRYGRAWAEMNSDMGSIGGFLTGIPFGIVGFAENIASIGAEDAPVTMAQAMTGSMQGNYGFVVGNQVGNVLPSVIAATAVTLMTGSPTAGRATGSLITAAGAGGGAYRAALQEGWTKEQATTYGWLIAAAEGGISYILDGIGAKTGVGTEKLLNMAKAVDNRMARLVLSGAISVSGELSEELIQLYLEPAIKSAVIGVDYEAPGWDEAMDTAIITAFTTMILNGGSTVKAELDYTAYGKLLLEEYAPDEALDWLMEQSVPGGDAYKLAQKLSGKLADGKTVAASDIGRVCEFLFEEKAQTSKKTASEEAEQGGVIPFSETEANNLSSHKGIVSGHGITFRQFIDNVKNIGNTVRYYFGKVSSSLGARISSATGHDVTGFNIAIRSDEVLHAFSSHGDAKKEALRGHLPVTADVLERLPEVFNVPDDVVPLSEKDYAGRTAFEIRKYMDGQMVVVVGIANGKHSIEVDTVYVIDRKRHPTTVNAAQDAHLDHTSETSSGEVTEGAKSRLLDAEASQLRPIPSNAHNAPGASEHTDTAIHTVAQNNTTVNEGEVSEDGIQWAGREDVDSEQDRRSREREAVEQAMLEEAAEGFGEEGKRQFIKNYDGRLSVSTYERGFRAYYEGGQHGTAIEDVRTPVEGFLKDSQKQAAHMAGQIDGPNVGVDNRDGSYGDRMVEEILRQMRQEMDAEAKLSDRTDGAETSDDSVQQLRQDYFDGRITEEEFDQAMDALMEEESASEMSMVDGIQWAGNEQITETAAEHQDNNTETEEMTYEEQRGQSAARDGGRIGEYSDGETAQDRGRRAEEEAQRRSAERSQIQSDVKALGVPLTSLHECGLSIGSKIRSNRIIPQEAWTDSIQRAADIAAENGLKFVPLTGILCVEINGKRLRVEAVIENGVIYVQADSIQRDVVEVTNHEVFHAKIEGDPDLQIRLVNHIKQTYSNEEISNLIDRYAEIYSEFVDSDDLQDLENLIWEEMLADAYADLERFSGTEGPTQWGEYVRGEMTQAETKNTVQQDGEARMSIETLPDGKKYVRADRRVLYGNDPEAWSEQLEDYINGKIRRGQDVLLLTDDGDVLTLTANTAGKVSSRYNNDGTTMSDEAFERKANAGAHIDELASISVKDPVVKKDFKGRHGELAENGWSYRRAYFEDFDGSYYQVSISVAMGADGNVIYNIGQMQRRSSLTLNGSSVKNGALSEETSYGNSISRNAVDVNGKMQERSLPQFSGPSVRDGAQGGETSSDISISKDGENSNRNFSFAGEGAMTADEAALQMAKEMQDSGEDMETIRQETGWYQDFDGRWQFDNGELRWAGNETMLETEADAEYTGSDEDLGVRGDPKNMPNSSREWSVFNRSFANKTMGMKPGETRSVIIRTANNEYAITAYGYMKGYADAKMPIDEKQAQRRTNRKERVNGADTNRRTADRWVDAVRLDRGGTGGDLSISSDGRATMENDRLSDGTSERNRTGNPEGDAENYQGIDSEEYLPGSLVYDGHGRAYQADESGNLTELAIDEQGNADKPRFSMAGEGAMTADEAALQIAQDMLDSGEDMETIRQETGWYQDLDGRWQFDNGELRWAGNETMLETEAEYTRAEENDNPYAGKNMAEDSEIYSYDFLVSQPDMQTVQLPEVDAVRDIANRVDTAKVVNDGMENARAVGEEQNGKTFVTNIYTGRRLRVTSNSIRHGLNGNVNRVLTNARLGAVVGEVLQNAIPINALHNKAEGVAGTYAMAAYATDSKGREFVSIVTVEQRTGTVIAIETYDMLHALSGRQKRVDSQADTKSQSIHSIKAVNTISISNLLRVVNATHRSILSQDVLKHLGQERDPNGYYADRVKFSAAGVEAEHIVRSDDMTDEQYAELDARWQSRQKADRSLGVMPLDELIITKDRFASTPAMEKLGIRIDGTVARYRQTEQLRAFEKAAQQSRKMYLDRVKALNVSKQELELARGLVEGWLTPGALEGTKFDIDVIAEVADYMAAAQSFSEDMIAQRKSEINEANFRIAEEMFRDSDAFSPKLKHLPGLTKIVMNERTPERVVKQIFGPEVGGKIYETYFRPVWVNGAEMHRFENRMLDRIRMFEDQNGVERKLTKKEREFAQRLMEGKAVVENMARLTPDVKERVEVVAQNVNNGQDFVDAVREWGLYEEYHHGIAQAYADYMDTVSLSKDMDQTIMDNAIREYQAIYNEFYDAINDFLVSHGYSEIGFIKGYAPHFQKQEVQQGLFGALKKMGVEKESVSQLPADIAGRTADFKPNMRWNPHAQTRKGSKTDYDIQVGFERYLHYAAEMFYHTDDVMRVRQAVNWFRQQYSSKEISAALEDAQADRYKTPEWKKDFLIEKELIMPGSDVAPREVNALYDEYISELYDRAAPEKLSKYSEFVTWLDNYANILAGKQSLADRGLEYGGGRDALNMGGKLMRAFAASNVAGNVSSVLNQAAQLPLIRQQLGGAYLERAVYDLRTGRAAKENFAERSDFLTDKRGVDKLTMDNREKFISALFKPATMMDGLVSTLAVRGRYLQALDEGMTPEQAMREADDFGRRVMGSRMKGAKPLGFESKRFISQMIHVFQVEASNTFDYMLLSDIPQTVQQVSKSQGKAAAARYIAAYAVGYLLSAFLLNRLTDELYGGTPAPFDLIGWGLNFVACGFGKDDDEFMRVLIDGAWEKLFGSRPFGTEPLEEEDGIHWAGSMKNLGYNLLNDVPYVRNAAGVLGLGDQSMPTVGFNEMGEDLADAGITLWNQITKGEDETGLDWAGAAQRIGEDLLYAATGMLPGGRQVKKTYQGTKALIQGGKVSGYGDNERMQYPVERSVWNAIRGGLFGVSALGETDEFYAAELSALSAGQTKKVRELEEQGIDRFVTYDLYQQFREINAELSGVDASTAKRNAINALPLTDQQKFQVFDAFMMDRTADNYEKTRNEYQAMLDADLTWDEITQVHNYHAELNADEELKAAEKATALAKFIDEQGWNEEQQMTLEARFRFWSMVPAKASSYEKFEDAGLVPESAEEMAELLASLEPEDGKNSVSDNQKVLAIWNSDFSKKDKETAIAALVPDRRARFVEAGVSDGTAKALAVDLAVAEAENGDEDLDYMAKAEIIVDGTRNNNEAMAGLSTVLDENTYEKLEIATDFGVTAKNWVDFKKCWKNMYGDDSVNQDKVETVLKRMNIPNNTKAALWQISSIGYSEEKDKVTGWAAKNNPYSVSVGQQIREEYRNQRTRGN